MISPFSIGDKVVCINAQFLPDAPARHSSLPVEGQIYCVRETYIDLGSPGVRLVGIYGIISPFTGRERGFYATRFRKVWTQGVSQVAVQQDVQAADAAASLEGVTSS